MILRALVALVALVVAPLVALAQPAVTTPVSPGIRAPVACTVSTVQDLTCSAKLLGVTIVVTDGATGAECGNAGDVGLGAFENLCRWSTVENAWVPWATSSSGGIPAALQGLTVHRIVDYGGKGDADVASGCDYTALKACTTPSDASGTNNIAPIEAAAAGGNVIVDLPNGDFRFGVAGAAGFEIGAIFTDPNVWVRCSPNTRLLPGGTLGGHILNWCHDDTGNSCPDEGTATPILGGGLLGCEFFDDDPERTGHPYQIIDANGGLSGGLPQAGQAVTWPDSGAGTVSAWDPGADEIRIRPTDTGNLLATGETITGPVWSIASVGTVSGRSEESHGVAVLNSHHWTAVDNTCRNIWDECFDFGGRAGPPATPNRDTKVIRTLCINTPGAPSGGSCISMGATIGFLIEDTFASENWIGPWSGSNIIAIPANNALESGQGIIRGCAINVPHDGIGISGANAEWNGLEITGCSIQVSGEDSFAIRDSGSFARNDFNIHDNSAIVGPVLLIGTRLTFSRNDVFIESLQSADANGGLSGGTPAPGDAVTWNSGTQSGTLESWDPDADLVVVKLDEPATANLLANGDTITDGTWTIASILSVAGANVTALQIGGVVVDVSGNTVRGGTNRGLIINNVTHGLFHGNTFETNVDLAKEAAVDVFAGGACSQIDVTVSENIIAPLGATSRGINGNIAPNHCPDYRALDNVIDLSNGATYGTLHVPIVRGNTITMPSGGADTTAGIYVDVLSPCEIIGNRITVGTANVDGIRLVDATECEVSRNKIFGVNGATGFAVEEAGASNFNRVEFNHASAVGGGATGAPFRVGTIGAGGCDGAGIGAGSSCYHNTQGGAGPIAIARRVAFSGWAVNPDGTECQIPVPTTLGGGASVGAAVCNVDNAATIYLKYPSLPAGYAGTTFRVGVSAIATSATPSGDLDADVALQCRGAGDLHSNTWGSELPLDLTFDTTDEETQATTGELTPNGTCLPGDAVLGRYQIDSAGSDVTIANAIHGFYLEFGEIPTDY